MPQYGGTGPALGTMLKAGTRSYLRPFGQGQSIIDIHTQIPDRILDIGMAEQNLHRPQIARGLVDQ